MITLKSAENALKTLYLGVVSDQLNTKANPLLAQIEQTASDVWGKEIRKLAPYGINGGIGAGTETGDLPMSAENNYAQFVLTLKNLYGTIEISDKAIRASQNNSGAFVDLLNAEMEGLLKASKFNFGRMLYGDGSGKLATISSASSNNLVVDDLKNLMEGMVVDVLTAMGGSTGIGARRITSIDRDTKTVTLSGNTISSGVISAGNILVVQGSYNNELTGLGAIFGEGNTLYGIDKTQNKWLKPKSYVADGGKIDDVTIQKVIDNLEEVAGSTANFIVCPFGVKRAYQEYLTANRTNVDVMNLAGGYKAISYNGIPIVSDRFAPSGTMYVLNTNEFNLHQLCDWRWLEGDDGKIIRQVANKPVYTATLVKYADLICNKPSGQAQITGISEK